MDLVVKTFQKLSPAISFFKALKLFFKYWRNGELEYIFSDELTLLPNRKKFLNDYHPFVRRADRHNLCSALVLIDLDNLKTVNDNFGHPYGDFLISSFGEAIRKSLREYDLPARWGGDEFIILVEGLQKDSDENEALINSIVERVKNNWKSIIIFSEEFHKIADLADFSHGYSCVVASDILEAIAEADRNMYREKRLKKVGKK